MKYMQIANCSDHLRYVLGPYFTGSKPAPNMFEEVSLPVHHHRYQRVKWWIDTKLSELVSVVV